MMLVMCVCVDHDKSLVIVIPKYLVDETYFDRDVHCLKVFSLLEWYIPSIWNS